MEERKEKREKRGSPPRFVRSFLLFSLYAKFKGRKEGRKEEGTSKQAFSLPTLANTTSEGRGRGNFAERMDAE